MLQALVDRKHVLLQLHSNSFVRYHSVSLLYLLIQAAGTANLVRPGEAACGHRGKW